MYDIIVACKNSYNGYVNDIAQLLCSTKIATLDATAQKQLYSGVVTVIVTDILNGHVQYLNSHVQIRYVDYSCCDNTL